MARTRTKLPLVPEEMRRVFSLLAEEVCTWPDVHTRLMFGFRAVYRGGGKWLAFEVKGEEGIGEVLAVLESAYARARPTGCSFGNRG